MKSGNGNGYVTRKELLAMAALMLTLVATIGSWAWNVHVQQPHPGAISDKEFERVSEMQSSNINSRFDRVERRQDQISTKLDNVIQKLGDRN